MRPSDLSDSSDLSDLSDKGTPDKGSLLTKKAGEIGGVVGKR